MSKSGKDWLETSIASIPEANLTALPNFDLVVSTGMAPRVLYSLACLAKVKNDETFLCFTLEKETYVAGLKSGFPESEVENLRNWLKPPENVSSTLAEWNASFYGAKVRTARLLKVESKEVLILPDSSRSKARRSLASFLASRSSWNAPRNTSRVTASF